MIINKQIHVCLFIYLCKIAINLIEFFFVLRRIFIWEQFLREYAQILCFSVVIKYFYFIIPGAFYKLFMKIKNEKKNYTNSI